MKKSNFLAALQSRRNGFQVKYLEKLYRGIGLIMLTGYWVPFFVVFLQNQANERTGLISHRLLMNHAENTPLLLGSS